MESLDQLHRQLESLDELHTIVKTMKALSAASIRQYEQAVSALAAYYLTVERGLHVALEGTEPPSPPRRHHESKRLAAIVFGSDHGLCGRFNEEITEYALERMDSAAADPQHRLLLAVGARVAASLEHAGQRIEENFLVPGSASQITATVQQILLKLDEWREQAGVHYIYLFYNRHSGGEGYHPTGFELLPINLRRFHRLEEEIWPSRVLPTFTMEREALLSRLLHQYLFVTIFRACAESQASEHASRLAAMQSAERNLNERQEEVTMLFRRARQNTITAELLDVVAGFEAITSEEQ
ncbi:MAG: F0F1 ATP synthase subunit gamma [Gammaproteobacteria bacterium]|nr:F0F1 ATP synthase subunit gamma [Gammaproteobacteria bacterium]MCW8841493.1 F0F1 ATP synthase subunit gamma [Gammaproteobacteria bacterium]MCW8927553.1 F0F1 ATP synthase subunit gamma [Gammaproteobacteria bacterium]MCW8957753.1 F0F1 ATP synthase subunit gamma [Gammaproteobacteria bacterium]MCW8972491.1 F0F1 ATP synthase subunit gamma [Gammaproteobacteria bacterium]